MKNPYKKIHLFTWKILKHYILNYLVNNTLSTSHVKYFKISERKYQKTQKKELVYIHST